MTAKAKLPGAAPVQRPVADTPSLDHRRAPQAHRSDGATH